MKYYLVEPEVAGGWGEGTGFTRTPGKPTVVHKLHYHFDGWLGDALLTTTPCFIVTESLALTIAQLHLTGASFDTVEITVSNEFRELYPSRALPKFVWLKIDGQPGRDDFGLTQSLELVLSDQALAAVRAEQLSHASVCEYHAE